MTDQRAPSAAELQDRLRQVRAALRDMPPHSGSGTRQALHDEVLRLERRLATQRSSPDDGAPGSG